MKKNYFNYKQVNDKYLLTNDIGRYVFLTLLLRLHQQQTLDTCVHMLQGESLG